MTEGTVLYEVADHIALITLNRPERLNAIVNGMGELYTDCLRRADADPDVRAIVVTGAGRGFCSGADLTMLAEGSDALNAYLAEQGPDTLPTFALRIGTPVVTAINGPCAGIGFVLAISADARFASRTATFSSTFARLGLIALSFFALATYVAIESLRALFDGHAAATSTVGIAVATVSLVVMPGLSWAQRRTGRALGSTTVVADSKQTLLCTYLSAVLLVGLLLNAWLGWWWADPVVGLVVAGLAVREGRDAWRGEGCC